MLIHSREKADIWSLLAPPAIWALHFLLCYVIAAIDCAATADAFAVQMRTRWVVGIATAVALALILVAAAQARRHWGFGTEDPPHDGATPEDRQRFLGFATLLLSALSFVSVVFVALPALTIADCR